MFVSYTLNDGLLTIDNLQSIHDLVSQYAICFIDVIDNNSVDRQKKVIDTLNQSDVMLLLVSPGIKKSKWVRLEYQIAQDLSIPIYEVNVEDGDFKERIRILLNKERING